MLAVRPVEGKRITRNIGSYHQSHEPRVFFVIASVAEAVEKIVVRIRREENDRGCGSYLYIAPDGSVYVIREDQTASQRWIREHFPWLVGFYTKLPNPNRGLSLEAQGIFEDITEHMKQASTASDGRQCVGPQQDSGANCLQPATDVAALQRSEAVTAAEGDISSSGGGASSNTGAEE